MRVALFVKASASTTRRDDRNMGMWSYPVAEFEWEHFPHDNQRVDLSQFKDYDLIFHEDAGFCTYANKHQGPPVIFYAIDSTLSEDHYQKRLTQGKQADLIVVDHDQLSRFKGQGVKARRLNYCVNDRLFKPAETKDHGVKDHGVKDHGVKDHGVKDHEVDFHCGGGASRGMPGGKEREAIRAWLDGFCKARGWRYESGSMGVDEYARRMAAGKVVVNWPRTVSNRPHRVFDTLACKTALLTGPIPQVDGDGLAAERHYRGFDNEETLGDQLAYMLNTGDWEEMAERGHELVMGQHTWAIRAQELREMVREEFGI